MGCQRQRAKLIKGLEEEMQQKRFVHLLLMTRPSSESFPPAGDAIEIIGWTSDLLHTGIKRADVPLCRGAELQQTQRGNSFLAPKCQHKHGALIDNLLSRREHK